eukprot:CAMPEP_0197361794 /NCGR_PEP_ID=MMETSP0893-20130614/63600_1 /TAXON_ID=44058 ORGANISM="Aureoumbra lagunensis, Strain CCMP1510" /NCGR_SAMPLE_ID=MMETSP0893 /ASSEMBLY_ACC=CAM_ASM_000539 /LENGTH=357 /DNA_ID=CAMNT_0042883407 /DNA_START=645 /DNA_END=1718 /DNA_ORIENTATION=-
MTGPTAIPTSQPTSFPTVEPKLVPTPRPTSEINSSKNSTTDSSIVTVVVAVIAVLLVFGSIVVYCCWWNDRNTNGQKYQKNKHENSQKFHEQIALTHFENAIDEAKLTQEEHTSKKQEAQVAARANGLALINSLLVAGESLPLLRNVCSVGKAILIFCDQQDARAADIAAAGARTVATLKVLSIITENASSLNEDEAKTLVEQNMNELYDYLCQFQCAVESYSDKSWLRKKWYSIAHNAKLGSLDKKIVICLDQLRLSYSLAHDRHITKLLESQTYRLEASMKEQIESVVEKQRISPEAAADQLANDENARAADVAAAGARTVATLKVLSIITENVSSLNEDEAKTLVEQNMNELYD